MHNCLLCHVLTVDTAATTGPGPNRACSGKGLRISFPPCLGSQRPIRYNRATAKSRLFPGNAGEHLACTAYRAQYGNGGRHRRKKSRLPMGCFGGDEACPWGGRRPLIVIKTYPSKEPHAPARGIMATKDKMDYRQSGDKPACAGMTA